MKDIINKIHNFFNKKSDSIEDNDMKNEDIKTVYINTVDELDQFFHDRVMLEMKGLKKPEKVNIILKPDIYKMGTENLFDIMMMKSMQRCMTDTDLMKDSKKEIQNNNRSNSENGILSLVTNDKSTIH